MRVSVRRLVRWLSLPGALLVTSLSVGQPAQAFSPDWALARSLIGPSDPIDPVLVALSEGRLVRDVAAPVAGAVILPAVRYGFALTGEQLAMLDITASPEADLEVDRFVSRLRGRGMDPSGSFTVYTLPPIQDVIDAASTSGTDA